jgi:hypothetical protein
LRPIFRIGVPFTFEIELQYPLRTIAMRCKIISGGGAIYGFWRIGTPASGETQEDAMGLITALAISISVLGGIATFLVFGPLAGIGIQIWIAFIAWATFYHCGGKESGLSKTLTNNIFGAIVAWVALLLVTQIPLASSLGLPLWAGICVLVTVFVLVYAAHNAMVSDIPASVFGYAATAGLALAGNKLGAVLAPSLENPLVIAVISLIVGAILGYISEKIAGLLAQT